RRASPPALPAAPATPDASRSFLREASDPLAPNGLPALVTSLRPVARGLTPLDPQLDALFGLVAPVSRCVSNNIVPTLLQPLDDGVLSTGQPAWQEILRTFVGLGSASQNFDGNGDWVRFMG